MKKECKFIINIFDKKTRKRIPARIVFQPKDKILNLSEKGRVYNDGRFYAEGKFWVECEPGKFELQVFHGYEYIPDKLTIEAVRDKITTFNVYMMQWVDLNVLGWYCGDNHWHMHHDEVSGLENPPDYKFASLVCRAEGLDYATEQGSKGYNFERDSKECLKQSRRDFILRTSCEQRFFLNGHYDTPGIKSTVDKEEIKKEMFPGQALKKAVHEKGGITIVTHPFGCIPILHWMTAVEVYFDVVLDNYPDAFDVFCYNREIEQIFYFTLLNLGAKIAGTASTDALLERKQAGPPGKQRVYTYTGSNFTYEAIVDGIKAGRNFVTDGHIFPVFTIDGKMPGDTIAPETKWRYEAKILVYALNKIKKIELIRNGVPVKVFEPLVKPKGYKFEVKYEFAEGESCWYSLRVRDENNNCALTDPIYFENPFREKKFSYCIALCLGNFTEDLGLEKEFNLHIACAIGKGFLKNIFLLKDGIPKQEFSIGEKQNYAKFRYPLEHSGYYHIQVETTEGTILTESLLFDTSDPNSHQISYLSVGSRENHLEIKGWCEDIPLADVGKDKDPSYICWFNKDKAFEIKAILNGVKYEFREGTDLSAFFNFP